MKILNRIVTFLLALAVFPALYFRILLRAVVSISSDSAIYKIISAFSENINRKMEITVSLKEAVRYWQNGTFSVGSMDFDLNKIPKDLLVTKNWLIAAAAFIVITLIIAIVIMGCALFTKAHRTVFALSLGGAASFVTALVLFGKAARPLLDGTIDVASTVLPYFVDSESFFGSIAVAALNGAINVDTCGLGGAVYGAMIVMFAVAVWEFAYYITIPKEEKLEKKVKA